MKNENILKNTIACPGCGFLINDTNRQPVSLSSSLKCSRCGQFFKPSRPSCTDDIKLNNSHDDWLHFQNLSLVKTKEHSQENQDSEVGKDISKKSTNKIFIIFLISVTVFAILGVGFSAKQDNFIKSTITKTLIKTQMKGSLILSKESYLPNELIGISFVFSGDVKANTFLRLLDEDGNVLRRNGITSKSAPAISFTAPTSTGTFQVQLCQGDVSKKFTCDSLVATQGFSVATIAKRAP